MLRNLDSLTMTSSVSSHEGVAPGEPPGKAPNRFASRLPTVLEVLKTAENPLTVHEIAAAARCSRITVRRHLDSLRRTGHVCLAGKRPRLDSEGKRLPSRRENEYRVAA
jgi:DNA-binding transcriptional ArsR family regulator